MIRAQKGFTLIELVMIIVIIGILAAVAIPRYISLQADARVAAVRGLFGTVRSASGMIHATALVRGVTAGNVAMEDGTLVTVVNRYPATAAGGIDNAVQFTPTDFDFGVVGPGVFSHLGAAPANRATCSVTYTEPAALGNAPNIAIVDTNCN